MLHYFLYCLNLKSGKVEWQKEFYTGRPPGGRHRKNSFVSESPVTDGKFVYVYVANLGLWAFDLKGKPAWSTPLEANPIYLDFGTGSSPALAGNLLVIVNDNEKQQYIAAFDKQTGKQVWRTNRDIGGKGQPVQRSGWATPFVWRHALRTEVVAVGPGDGRELRPDGERTVAHVGNGGDADSDALRLRRTPVYQRRAGTALVRAPSRCGGRYLARKR